MLSAHGNPMKNEVETADLVTIVVVPNLRVDIYVIEIDAIIEP